MELNEILREKRITIAKLSEQTGICRSTIEKYSCKNRKITVENAKKIAKVLEIDWWRLFDN